MIQARVMNLLLSDQFAEDIICFHREAFAFFLERELLRAQRYSSFLTHVLFHIDDRLGDPDDVELLAGCIHENLRHTDILGSLDRETLAVLLLNCKAGNAEQIIQRLKVEFSARTAGLKTPRVRVSSVVFPTEANSPEAVLRLAIDRLHRPNGESLFLH